MNTRRVRLFMYHHRVIPKLKEKRLFTTLTRRRVYEWIESTKKKQLHKQIYIMGRKSKKNIITQNSQKFYIKTMLRKWFIQWKSIKEGQIPNWKVNELLQK